MALVGDTLYVANTDALVRFPYEGGATQITARGSKVVDLPAGSINHHWTKNVIASEEGSKFYVTVGSNSKQMHGSAKRRRLSASSSAALVRDCCHPSDIRRARSHAPSDSDAPPLFDPICDCYPQSIVGRRELGNLIELVELQSAAFDSLNDLTLSFRFDRVRVHWIVGLRQLRRGLSMNFLDDQICVRKLIEFLFLKRRRLGRHRRRCRRQRLLLGDLGRRVPTDDHRQQTCDKRRRV
jgi:hypothetical protein